MWLENVGNKLPSFKEYSSMKNKSRQNAVWQYQSSTNKLQARFMGSTLRKSQVFSTVQSASNIKKGVDDKLLDSEKLTVLMVVVRWLLPRRPTRQSSTLYALVAHLSELVTNRQIRRNARVNA